MTDAEHFVSSEAQSANRAADTGTAAKCEEEAQAVPVLRAWLGNSQDHPLLALFGPPADLPVPPGVRYTWWRDPVLTTFNNMLDILERSGPAGLDHMRNRFRYLRATNPEGRKDFTSPHLAASLNPHADPTDLHDLQTALGPVRHHLGL